MSLRIEIDGHWSAADFAAFYQSLNELYQFFLFDRDPFWLERGPYGRYIGYRRIDGASLEVEAIQFASPGFTDLTGIAAAVKELREFMQFVITHISERGDRRLDRELKQLDIQERKLDLLRKLSELPEIPPGKADQMKAIMSVRNAQLPDIDPIIDGVIEERVVGCKSVVSKRQTP